MDFDRERIRDIERRHTDHVAKRGPPVSPEDDEYFDKYNKALNELSYQLWLNPFDFQLIDEILEMRNPRMVTGYLQNSIITFRMIVDGIVKEDSSYKPVVEVLHGLESTFEEALNLERFSVQSNISGVKSFYFGPEQDPYLLGVVGTYKAQISSIPSDKLEVLVNTFQSQLVPMKSSS